MVTKPDKPDNNTLKNNSSILTQYPTDFTVENLYSSESVSCLCVIPDKDCDIPAAEYKEKLKEIAIYPVQTHSLNVSVVTRHDDYHPDTDALVTFVPDLRIGVLTADCVPILLYAPDIRGIAAIHAGWKGTLGGIVDKTIDCLERYGADPSRTVAIFGPSISMKAYEVDEDLAVKFSDSGFGDCVYRPEGHLHKPHIDLQAVNMKRLIRRHLNPDNILSHPDCTLLTISPDTDVPKYPSHRRNGTGLRILTTIVLKKVERRNTL